MHRTAATRAARTTAAPARMDGVRQDLRRAVRLNQITEEQATKFAARLAARIRQDSHPICA